MKNLDARIRKLEKAVSESEEETPQSQTSWYEEMRRLVRQYPETWKREILCFHHYLTSELERIEDHRKLKRDPEDSSTSHNESPWESLWFLNEEVYQLMVEDGLSLDSIDRSAVQKLFAKAILASDSFPAPRKDDLSKLIFPYLGVGEERYRIIWELPFLVNYGGPYWAFDACEGEWKYHDYPTWNGTMWVNQKGERACF